MTARAVLVEWLDACHVEPGAWCERDVAAESSPCGVLTAGWLLEADDDRLVVAQHLTEQGHASGVFVIPRSCVVRLDRFAPCGPLRSSSLPSRGRWWSWLFGGRE